MLKVTALVTSSFHLARSKYQAENLKWIDASCQLAGRVGIMPMMFNIQRAGETDLVLRAMEDEFDEKTEQETFAAHYQIMLSEIWVLACYEFLRAVRQRENEAARIARKGGLEPDADLISLMPEFVKVFGYLELLRMPIAKFEIADDRRMREPLVWRRHGGSGDSVDTIYDKQDPSRVHVMQVALLPTGRIAWQALDHSTSRQFWIERRWLSEALLDLVAKIEPAGLREARLVAEAAAKPSS